MDLQSIVQALRGAGGGGVAAQGAQQQGEPQQLAGGNAMASGAIALSPDYQQYREQMMMEGMPPLPPEQWAAQQGSMM